MPELPDVESFKEYFQANALHQEIADITVNSSRILDEITAEDLAKFRGKKFCLCTRFGKYLLAQADANLWLILHFGMTGSLKYYKEPSEEPQYSRLVISFTNGYCLSFNDQRKFGRVATASGMQNFLMRKQLGLDALEVELPAFRSIVKKNQGTMKSTLLNQHVIAGIGNIYADEILFQAAIHPQQKTSQLSDEMTEKLFNTMKRVLNFAVARHADTSTFPSNYLVHHRYRDANCPLGGGKVATTKVAGRTTYFCPNIQKMQKPKLQV